MGTKVLIGNLPPGTTEQEVIDELTERGFSPTQVLKLDANNPNKLQFTIEVDLDPQAAQTIAAKQANKGKFKGRIINLYVPMYQE